MENTITLGQAFAYLYFEKHTGDGFYNLKPKVNNYLKELKLRAEGIKQHKSADVLILTSKNKTDIDKTDLFIHIFLNDNLNQNNTVLLKFLNDNIEYFEQYSAILNDYIKKINELKQKCRNNNEYYL